MASASLAELITEHASTCDTLAGLYRERATTRSSELRSRASLFVQLNDGTRNITTIRAEVDAQATDLTAVLIELDGEIDALLAMLRGLEMEISAARGFR